MARVGSIVVKQKPQVMLEAQPIFDNYLSNLSTKELINYNDVYTTLNTIGEGGFGAVYKVIDNRTGELRAAKHIKVTKDNGRLDLGNLDSVNREVASLIDLSSRKDNIYIPIYYDSFVISKGAHWYYVIVSEYIEGPELGDYLNSVREQTGGVRIKPGTVKGGYIDESFIVRFALWLFQTVEWIHSYTWAHRDIKPRNIKFDEKNNRFVLLDFGISCLMNPNAGSLTCDYRDKSGTVIYMPPETLVTSLYGDTGITERNKDQYLGVFKKADIWMVGGTLYDMVENRGSLWGYENRKQIIKIINSTDHITFPFNSFRPVTKEGQKVYELISQCLNKYPLNRPSAERCANEIKTIMRNVRAIDYYQDGI